MNATLITTTPKSSMHALAFQGITATSCYAQIREMLLRKFGDGYMLLFARPVENAANDEIDWYSPLQGPARKIAALPLDEQAAARDAAAGMADEILKFAEELMQSGDHLKITRGNILRLALSCPDKNCLYVVGKQPVLTCWGFGPGTPGVEPESIFRLAGMLPASATAAQPSRQPEKALEREERKSYSLWWWLLPFLLLLLLFCLLFGSMGFLPALSGYTLFEVPASGFLGARVLPQDKIEFLRNEVGALETRLKSHMSLCIPEAVKNAEAAETKGADLPALEIPEKTDNTDFLEGKWLCETGLYSERTREPLKLYITFNKDGKGEATIYESHDQCRAPAAAKMENNRLYLELDRAECGNGPNSYQPVRIECFNDMGQQTECRGKYSAGKEWTAKFMRVK